MQATRYTRTAIILHWLLAVLLVGTFSVGIYMHELPLSPWKLKVYSWHKWAGVTIFLLVAVRLAWRTGHQPPPLPDTMPRWEQVVARGLHHLLYLLMLAIPLSGWLMSSAKGVQTVYFGILPLPDLVGKDKALGELFEVVHKGFNLTFAGLVIIHAAAAIKHHLVNRDQVLTRMLPFLARNR